MRPNLRTCPVCGGEYSAFTCDLCHVPTESAMKPAPAATPMAVDPHAVELSMAIARLEEALRVPALCNRIIAELNNACTKWGPHDYVWIDAARIIVWRALLGGKWNEQETPERIAELEHAVAMNSEAPQKLPATVQPQRESAPKHQMDVGSTGVEHSSDCWCRTPDGRMRELKQFTDELQHYAGASCYESDGQDVQDPDNCQKCRLKQIITTTHGERESEQPELREITAEEVLEIHRGIVWYAQEENGWNIGWTEFARRINELIRYRPAALSPQTDSQEPR